MSGEQQRATVEPSHPERFQVVIAGGGVAALEAALALRDLAGDRVNLKLIAPNAEGWGETGKGSHGYLPFGGDMHAEQRFGQFVIPSRITVGWRYGTADYAPFFRAKMQSLELASL